LSPSALIWRLEDLRERVLERLGSIEALARDRQTFPSVVDQGRDQVFELKQAALVEAEQRLKAQAERRDKEWAAALDQLEEDRRLLAAAWERIEQERIASANAPGPPPQGHSRGRGHSPQRSASTTHPYSGSLAAARSAATESEPNRPVGQTILRQFQALSNDVRRNAENRREPCSESRGSRL
jgi:hypothetical protein